MPWNLILLNAFAFFLFVMVYIAMLSAMDVVSGSFGQLELNLWFLTATGLGFLLFGHTFRRFSQREFRKLLYGLLGVNGISVTALAVGTTTAAGIWPLVAGLIAFPLSIGYIEGHIHYLMCRWLSPLRRGLCVGLSIALANLLQFLCDGLLKITGAPTVYATPPSVVFAPPGEAANEDVMISSAINSDAVNANAINANEMSKDAMNSDATNLNAMNANELADDMENKIAGTRANENFESKIAETHVEINFESNAAEEFAANNEKNKTAPPVSETNYYASSQEERLRKIKTFYNLSVRETEVLWEILQNHSINEMAENLFISPRTVKFHISSLLGKTGASSQHHLKQIIQEHDRLAENK